MEIADESDREFTLSIYEQYKKLMYSEAQKKVSPLDADDVVQDVVVKLIEKLDTLRGLKGKQRSVYIATATSHTAIDFIRRQNKESANFWNVEVAEAFNVDLDAEVEAKLIRDFNISEFNRIWPKLDEDVRFILESRYILKETDEELAKRYGIQVQSIRMRVTRAKRKAIAALKEVYINS